MRFLWVVPGMVGVLLVSIGVIALRAGSELSGSSLRRTAELVAPAERAVRTPAGEISIPIRVVTTGRATLVMVPVRVNGRGPFEFVLDTGASTSTVDRTLERRLTLPRTGETARVRGVTGTSTVPIVRLRGWTLGGQTLAGRTLTVTNMGQPGVSGLLGSDELRRFGRIAIDYQRKRLVLRDRADSRTGG